MDFKQRSKLARGISYTATAISTILLFFAFVFDFDVENGYFNGGALSSTFEAFFTFGFVLSVLAVFVSRKNLIAKELPSQNANKNSLALIGTLLILIGVVEILFDKSSHETVTMLVGMGVCGLGVYYLMLAINTELNLTIAKLISLLISACMPAGMVLGNSSNYHRHINSVENSLCAIFAVCILFYILYEGNFAFEGEYSTFYLSSALITLHAGTTISVAYILAYLLGVVNEEARFYHMLIALTICIAIRVKLNYFAKNADEKSPDEWFEIENPPQIEETITEEITESSEIEETEKTEQEAEQKETDE